MEPAVKEYARKCFHLAVALSLSHLDIHQGSSRQSPATVLDTLSLRTMGHYTPGFSAWSH